MGTLGWSVAVTLVVAMLVIVIGFSRLRALTTHVGSFEAALRDRTTSDTAERWVSGFGVYGHDTLVWWRSWSLRWRPERRWDRHSFVVTARVPLDQAGRPDLFLVQCRCVDDVFDLTMSSGAYSGLASWLEAAPPSLRNVVV